MECKVKNKRIMVVGGSAGQCHIIDVAHTLGCKVIVADKDVNCAGRLLADNFYPISTDAVDDLLAVARQEKVFCVVSAQSDLGMVTAAKINEKLNLPGISLPAARLFSDKLQMRRFLQEHGCPCPPFRHCLSKNDVDDFLQEYGMPFVAKPIDSQGSRGVRVVRSENDIAGLMDMQAYNRDAKGIIVEGFLKGDEYTVEGVLVAGRHYTLAISHKRHYNNLPCVSNQLLYGWEDGYKELEKEHDRLIESTGLTVGVTHSEYIKTENGFVLVEFSARGGGSLIASHIVPAVSGWDPEEIYLKEVLGEQIVWQDRRKGWAVLDFLDLEEKRIKCITGKNEIRQLPGVLMLQLSYRESETVKPVTNDTDRHGFYIAAADTRTDLNNLMQRVLSTLRVTYEEEK